MKFDLTKLREICQADEEEFQALGVTHETVLGPYIHIDRGADVLAVAHLDSVSYDKRFVTVETDDEIVLFSRALDDRLGAYIILELLPRLGVECDVLLTTGEESGNSTARYYAPEKEYNWMFQFDRSGTDVVCYQYEDKELRDRLEDIGFVVNSGLFSDISDMEDLGIKGINAGTAYYDNHSENSHAFLSETAYMVQMFVEFYNRYKDMHMPHEKVTGGAYGYYRGYGSYTNDDWEYKSVDWDEYSRVYKELQMDGMGYNEAHRLAMQAARYGAGDSYEAHGEYFMDCPKCGVSFSWDEDPTLHEVGMCSWCFDMWLKMDVDTAKVHTMTQEEWTEAQYRDLEEWDGEDGGHGS